MLPRKTPSTQIHLTPAPWTLKVLLSTTWGGGNRLLRVLDRTGVSQKMPAAWHTSKELSKIVTSPLMIPGKATIPVSKVKKTSWWIFTRPTRPNGPRLAPTELTALPAFVVTTSPDVANPPLCSAVLNREPKSFWKKVKGRNRRPRRPIQRFDSETKSSSRPA